MQSFFRQLNRDLKTFGLGIPQLIVDETALNHNIRYVQQQLKAAPHLQPRLVVKSLASMPLLKTLSSALNTQRFMVFHITHVTEICSAFSDAKILFGKPMPIRAVEQLYQNEKVSAHQEIHWLIDQFSRLKQYVELAQRLKLRLKVNLEIDVGLHRGGIKSHGEFEVILSYIQRHREYIELVGLMGYDAHVTKIPKMIKNAQHVYAESQKIYAGYIDIIQKQFPSLNSPELCFNGGGSPTFNFHVKQSVCNDLSFGSMLLKPSDFDSEYLTQLHPALFIATPVLKVLDSVELPGIALLDRVQKLKHQHAVFIYGGYWMGQYVYPPKTHPHLLYGRSTNQELVCVGKEQQISIDDHVFLRPSQSEVIIPQFKNTYLYREYRDDSFVPQSRFEQWENFRE